MMPYREEPAIEKAAAELAYGWIHCTQCGWGCQVHRADVEAGDYHDRQACPECCMGPCRINWEHFEVLPEADLAHEMYLLVRKERDRLTEENESLKRVVERIRQRPCGVGEDEP